MTQKKDESAIAQSPDATGKTETNISRRKFLSYSIGGIAAAVVGSLLYPLAGFTASPALSAGKEEWIAIGNIKDFVLNEPMKVEYSYKKQDGWMTVEQKRNCWVVAKDGESFDIFDPRCTHLGCAYHWEKDKNQFYCPCHGGKFDISGKVLGGPPPRPLDRVDFKIDGEKLLIKGA
ncbi:MAG: ubiquinol-cytochrome c reductase iron-sulfur subunit [Ruminiclostridium sp.]|nr:ubiquinol-cytochrome c reductase iron-sulfur subunit [Ruminiclostridium sp.]